MTREEKQKAVYVLKNSAPVFPLKKPEEYNDYVQTIKQVIDWLEQEPTTKNDLITLTFSKGALKYSCKDYVVYKKDWLRSHYGAEIDIMFGDSQYKERTTKNDLGVDCIDRDSAIKALDYDIKCFEFKSGVSKHMDDIAKLLNTIYETQVNNIKTLPSVIPQEPRCKNCKWWKDSDGKYRRGIGAESKCPIHTHAVYCGEGYCYEFSPKGSEE